MPTLKRPYIAPACVAYGTVIAMTGSHWKCTPGADEWFFGIRDATGPDGDGICFEGVHASE